MTTPSQVRRGALGQWWRLSLLGLVGVASFALVPLEDIVPVDVDPVVLRLVATIQPALLVLVFAAIGGWAAARVGLEAPAVRAWMDGRPIWPVLRAQLPAATGTGLAVAAILVLYVAMLPMVGASELLRFELPLATRLLYGGLTEEVLLRWGAMSLLVWGVWRLAGRPVVVPTWCHAAGIVLAALLFSVGHLPTLWMLSPNASDVLMMMVIVANFIPGVLFGWLFWRRGLEAAMAAHALAHLFGWMALLAL